MPRPDALDRPAQLRLLRQVREGSAADRSEALARLLLDFRAPALATIHRVLRSLDIGPEHAEEALQRAALRFVEVGIEHFRGEAAPRTYFVRIAMACAVDLGREAARRQRLERPGPRPPWQLSPGAGQRPDALLSARQVRQRLARCIGKLPDLYRDGIRRYYLQEAGDLRACAAEQGITRAAFAKRLSRARVMLARCLEEEEHG